MKPEAYVQVAAPGTGAKIRNLEEVVVKADGSEHTVENQVVVVSDPGGSVVDTGTAKVIRLLNFMLDELVELNGYMRVLVACETRPGITKRGGSRHIKTIDRREKR